MIMEGAEHQSKSSLECWCGSLMQFSLFAILIQAAFALNADVGPTCSMLRSRLHPGPH